MVYVAVTERQATPTQVFSYGRVYLHFYEIKTIVSRTYGTLQKARRSARQASYFIKYNLIKALKIF